MVISSIYSTIRGGDQFPGWAVAIGWICALIPFSSIPIYWVYHTVLKTQGTFYKVNILLYNSIYS